MATPYPRQDITPRTDEEHRLRLAPDPDRPSVQRQLRTMMLLVGCYVGLCLATLVAIIVLRDHPSIVTQPTWVRVIIVFATALLMIRFAAGTVRGDRRLYGWFRVTSAIVLAAIVAVIAVPGDFPLWLKIEQGVCGLLLLGVVLIINGRRVRSAFAERDADLA